MNLASYPPSPREGLDPARKNFRGADSMSAFSTGSVTSLL